MQAGEGVGGGGGGGGGGVRGVGLVPSVMPASAPGRVYLPFIQSPVAASY